MDKQTLPELDEVRTAVPKTRLSRIYIYRLPPNTPGIYVFGRKKMICVPELLAWARSQAEARARMAKRPPQARRPERRRGK